MEKLQPKLKSLSDPLLAKGYTDLAKSLASTKHHIRVLKSIVATQKRFPDKIPNSMRNEKTLTRSDVYKDDPRSLKLAAEFDEKNLEGQKLLKEVIVKQRELEMVMDMEYLRSKLLVGLYEIAIDHTLFEVNKYLAIHGSSSLPIDFDSRSVAFCATYRAISIPADTKIRETLVSYTEESTAELLKLLKNEIPLKCSENDQPKCTSYTELCGMHDGYKAVAEIVSNLLCQYIPACTYEHQQNIDILVAAKKSNSQIRARQQSKLIRSATEAVDEAVSKEQDAAPASSATLSTVINAEITKRLQRRTNAPRATQKKTVTFADQSKKEEGGRSPTSQPQPTTKGDATQQLSNRKKKAKEWFEKRKAMQAVKKAIEKEHAELTAMSEAAEKRTATKKNTPSQKSTKNKKRNLGKKSKDRNQDSDSEEEPQREKKQRRTNAQRNQKGKRRGGPNKK